MLVPEMVLVAVVLPIHAERISTPGLKTSTRLPKLENDARASLESIAPTVMALGSEAGEKPEASAAELPAATTTVTPRLYVLLRRTISFLFLLAIQKAKDSFKIML